MLARRLLAYLACAALASCDGGNQAPSESPADRARPGSPDLPQIIEVFGVGPSTYVRSLAIEPEANRLWVGTSLGVNEIDLADNRLVNTFTREHGLANEYIFAIAVDEDGYKWFGTNAGGMSRYRDGDWKVYFPMHGLADYWVYAFANAADGGLWIGTWAGANYFDRRGDHFETYVSELVNEWVYGIAVDSDGSTWFATEGGISRFDGDSWTSWNHLDGIGGANLDGLPPSRNTGLGTRSRHDLGVLSSGRPTYNPGYVFSIIADLDDKIWAGTWGGGVTRFEGNRWTNLTENDGLAGNIVYSIAQGADGVYWFGTNKGLSRYDGVRFHNWNIHHGLPSNDVYAIEIAPNGDIWVGTRGGVTRLAPVNESASARH